MPSQVRKHFLIRETVAARSKTFWEERYQVQVLARFVPAQLVRSLELTSRGS